MEIMHSFLCSALAAAAFTTVAANPLKPPMDEAKVAAIAAALPEKPGLKTIYDRDRLKPGDVKSAEQLLSAPVAEAPDELYLEFSRNGNRTRYQKKYFTRRSNLERLVKAECFERQGRFIPKIVEYLDAINSMRSWVLPAHDGKLDVFENRVITVDLVSSSMANDLAQILLALGERLPAATRERTMAEMRRRVFDPYLEDNARAGRKRNWWFFGGNNWNAVCHSGCVRGALTILEDRTERARFVEAGMRSQPAFLAGFTPDGYCSEGMGYWEYGFGNYLDLGEAIREATGGKFDLFKEGGERARAAAGYPFAYQLERNVSPHFADGGGNPSVRRREQCRRIWPDIPAEGALPLRSAFDDAQVYISRTVEGRPFSVAVKGGHNQEQHNHNDVGTWTLMLSREELAGDPGGEEYTARTFSKNRYVSKVLNSFGHPVPRVAGELQRPGRKYAAKVLKREFTPEKDTLTLDLAGAYELPGLKRLVRTTVFDRAARAFTVTDEVEFDSPRDFDSPIITFCNVVKGTDASRLELKTKKGAKASVTIAAEGGEWQLQEEEIENPNRRSPKRIAVAFTRPVTTAKVSFTIKEEK